MRPRPSSRRAGEQQLTTAEMLLNDGLSWIGHDRSFSLSKMTPAAQAGGPPKPTTAATRPVTENRKHAGTASLS